MGIIGFLRQFFRKKPREEALQSPQSTLQSIQSKAQSTLQSIQSKAQSTLQSSLEEELPTKPSSIELQRDSLQLGLAAGYAGKSLREIEGSLNRIESQMVTRDWFTSQFEDKTPELIDILKKHEKNEEKRFETIQNVLNSIKKTAEKTPEPVRAQIFEQIGTIEEQLPLTQQMEKVVAITKEYGEISYEDLAAKLGISSSALRSLLSLTVRRTKQIQRFRRGGKGWVRFIA